MRKFPFYMLYQTFCVKIADDENQIYVSSLLKGKHTVNWQQIEQIGHSTVLHGSYFKTTIGKFWFFETQMGHDELLGLLTEKTSLY